MTGGFYVHYISPGKYKTICLVSMRSIISKHTYFLFKANLHCNLPHFRNVPNTSAERADFYQQEKTLRGFECFIGSQAQCLQLKSTVTCHIFIPEYAPSAFREVAFLFFSSLVGKFCLNPEFPKYLSLKLGHGFHCCLNYLHHWFPCCSKQHSMSLVVDFNTIAKKFLLL